MLYMFLADGFEETEAIGALDVIKRADIDIKTVGIGKKDIMGWWSYMEIGEASGYERVGPQTRKAE